MATKINGIEIPAGFGASLGGTPEESAKEFMRLASKGMANVMRDALIGAMGETVGAGPAPDWAKLVSGCVLQMDWETPPGTPIQTAVAFSSSATPGALGGVEWSGSISIKGTF